jgi:DNA repair protein RadC
MSEYHLRIKELPPTDQPRERLRDFGPSALSDAELLAILLRVGVAGTNVVQLAQQLLTTRGGWSGLMRTDYVELCNERGMGEAKTAALKAALEIGRRLLITEQGDRLQIKSPSDAARMMLLEIAHHDQEHLCTILLDTKNYVQAINHVYIGTLNSSVVRVCEVFRDAIKRNSASLILAHNHPSGDPTPSPEDVQVTRQIVSAGNLLDIDVLDHLVIGQGRYVSLRERGLGFERQ